MKDHEPNEPPALGVGLELELGCGLSASAL